MTRQKYLDHYLNDDGQLVRWPRRFAMKSQAVDYLASRFDYGRTYTEPEVNQLLRRWHLFDDPAMLRRYLCDLGRLDRRRDGSAYWRRPAP